jgi:glutamate dehydrogenase (NAD(P)+)
MADDVFSLMDDWGPEKVVCVSDARTGMKGVVVIDNTARGIGKGGTRMSPHLTIVEVARLARTMTYKWACVDLFHGGAKAGIVGDPNSPDKERVLRAWARALSNEIPSDYVAGLDMGLTEADAAIIQDELGDRGAAVGTPAELGGVPYDELGVTGFGVAEATCAAAAHADTTLQGARVAIQGFGAVGRAAAKRYAELGATIVAISTIKGALYDPDGLDITLLNEGVAEFGDAVVSESPNGSLLDDPQSLLSLPVEVLVPAATQDVIDDRSAGEIQAGIVVEGANLPTSAAARKVLKARGITVVPDFIANAGGAVSAGFAMDARYSAFRPGTDAIFTMISEKLRSNTERILRDADDAGITTHEAALALAQRRVRRAMELRGRVRR